MSDTKRKAYVTRYALTEGILELEGKVARNGYFRADNYTSSFSLKDWYPTREEAIKRAEEMRLKKIEYHKKSDCQARKHEV